MYLEKDIISLDCAKHAHVFLIKHNEDWIMIDTGFPRLYKNIVNELKDKYEIDILNIKTILLTHGDIDHIGNLKKIQKNSNAITYASSKELPYLSKQKAYSFLKRLFKIILRIPKFKNIKPFDSNKIGDIYVIDANGHTPGHVCYKYKNYLFVGDLIYTKNNQVNLIKDKMTFDKQQLISSIKNLDLSNIDFICPAHGDVVDVNLLKDFQKLLN